MSWEPPQPSTFRTRLPATIGRQSIRLSPQAPMAFLLWDVIDAAPHAWRRAPTRPFPMRPSSVSLPMTARRGLPERHSTIFPACSRSSILRPGAGARHRGTDRSLGVVRNRKETTAAWHGGPGAGPVHRPSPGQRPGDGPSPPDFCGGDLHFNSRAAILPSSCSGRPGRSHRLYANTGMGGGASAHAPLSAYGQRNATSPTCTRPSGPGAAPRVIRWNGLCLSDADAAILKWRTFSVLGLPTTGRPRAATLRIVRPFGGLQPGETFLFLEMRQFTNLWPAVVDLAGGEVIAEDEHGLPRSYRPSSFERACRALLHPVRTMLGSTPGASKKIIPPGASTRRCPRVPCSDARKQRPSPRRGWVSGRQRPRLHRAGQSQCAGQEVDLQCSRPVSRMRQTQPARRDRGGAA